jgi:hypothetical protein
MKLKQKSRKFKLAVLYVLTRLHRADGEVTFKVGYSSAFRHNTKTAYTGTVVQLRALSAMGINVGGLLYAPTAFTPDENVPVLNEY